VSTNGKNEKGNTAVSTTKKISYSVTLNTKVNKKDKVKEEGQKGKNIKNEKKENKNPNGKANQISSSLNVGFGSKKKITGKKENKNNNGVIPKLKSVKTKGK